MAKHDEFMILEGLDAIRKRPGTYIGDMSNVSNMVREVIDNGIDEFHKGVNDTVYIKIDKIEKKNIKVTVADKSKTGFPLDEAEIGGKLIGQTKMDASVSHLHAGSKFDKSTVMSGMNGCGNKAVNALSDHFFMVTKVINKNTKFPKQLKYNGEKWYYLEYSKGVKKSEGFAKSLKDWDLEDLKEYTTIVQFVPDLTLFETAEYFLPKGMDYVLKIAELTGKKLNIILNDKPYQSKVEDMKYKFDVTLPGSKDGKNNKVRLFGSFQMNGDILTKNNIGCVNGLAVHRGIHIDMFREAYKTATREIYGDAGNMEDNGVDATVFVLANEVDFDSQSKTKLSRIPDFDKNNIATLKNRLKDIMKENPDEFEENFAKIQNLRDKRGELNKRQSLINLLGDVTDDSTKTSRRSDSYKPKRLKDAWSREREQCELFIMEGQSAASSAFKTRNPEFQAIFPMRGVCKNTVGKDILEVLKNEEMNDLFRSIGAGVEGFSNLDKIRYGKIIYVPDEDCDGCFPGETLVHTLEYGDVSFEWLTANHTEDTFHVFSKDEQGNLAIGLAHHPRITRYTDKTIKLYYDNGTTTECTLDHKFLLNNNTYKEAQNLTTTDSISSVYTKVHPFKIGNKVDLEKAVYSLKHQAWIKEYQLVYELQHDTDYINDPLRDEKRGRYMYHHIDRNHNNNSPDNIKYLSRAEHSSIHGRASGIIVKYNKSEKHKNDIRNSPACRQASKDNMIAYNKSTAHRESVRWINKDPAIRALQDKTKTKMVVAVLKYFNLEPTAENFRLYNFTTRTLIDTDTVKSIYNELKDEDMAFIQGRSLEQFEVKHFMPFKCEDGFKLRFLRRLYDMYHAGLNINEENYLKYKARNDWTYEKGMNKLNFKTEEEATEFIKNYNHKLIKSEIIHYEKPIPVYDLTVDTYHNFALSNGEVVHNCRIAALIVGAFAAHAKFIIEAGKLFLMKTPFYFQGDKAIYADEAEKLDKSKPFERIKGLGGLGKYFHNAVTNADTRRLIQITEEDVNDALEILKSGSRKKALLEASKVVTNDYWGEDDDQENR